MARKKKTPEQIAADKAAHDRARDAVTLEDFEEFFDYPNQSVRAAAAHNRNATAEILHRFAHDKFWGVTVELPLHANVTPETLMYILELYDKNRGLVYGASRDKLKEWGYPFDENGTLIR